MYLKEEKGFTLIELMVVIVIVGILGAVAIPRFIVASHKAKASEAPTVLASIYSAAETYKAEEGDYEPAGNEEALDTTYGVQISNSKWFSYSLAETGNSTFTATAHVKSKFGTATTTDKITITDDGTKVASSGIEEYLPNWE